MSGFAAALQEHAWPRALGDVHLRFDQLMWVAETPRPPRTRVGGAIWAGAMGALGAAVLANVLGAPGWALGGLMAVASGGLFLALRTERLSRAQRRCVFNFATHQLRLDFHSPIAGRPRTLWVAFEDVQALDVLPQADGRACLLVDFGAGTAVLREVLVANVVEDELQTLHRLRTLLRAAVGLVPVAVDPGVPSDPPKPA